MSDLPAWESVKECPKCGEGREHLIPSIATQVAYFTPQPGFKYEHREATPELQYRYSGRVLKGAPEQIIVACPRCGWAWHEQPKDAGG